MCIRDRYKTLNEIIEKFHEVYPTYFNNEMQIYKILPPDAVTSNSSQQQVSVNIAPIDKEKSMVERCKNYGVAVDVDNMTIYLLFVQNQQVMSVIKGYCNNDTGYKLRFVVPKGEKDVTLMQTPYFIKGGDALSLQSMYKGLMTV